MVIFNKIVTQLQQDIIGGGSVTFNFNFYSLLDIGVLQWYLYPPLDPNRYAKRKVPIRQPCLVLKTMKEHAWGQPEQIIVDVKKHTVPAFVHKHLSPVWLAVHVHFAVAVDVRFFAP